MRRLIAATLLAASALPGALHASAASAQAAPAADRLERFVTDVKKDGRLLAAARAFKLEPIVVLQ